MAETGKWSFLTAIVLALVAFVNAFVFVGYLFDHDDGCKYTTHNESYTETHSITPPVVPTSEWVPFSWMALATGAMILLALVNIVEERCNNPTTSKVASVLSALMLAGLTVFAGILAKKVAEGCPGDFHIALVTTSIITSASSGLSAFFWGVSWSLGNFGKDFKDMAPRYRRARQFV